MEMIQQIAAAEKVLMEEYEERKMQEEEVVGGSSATGVNIDNLYMSIHVEGNTKINLEQDEDQEMDKS